MAIPELPPALTDPRPVLLIGTSLWTGAAIVAWLAGWDRVLTVSATGVAVGALGYLIFSVQRRAAARGRKGAQRMT